MGRRQNSFPGTETPLHQNAPGCDSGFKLIWKSQNSCGRGSPKSNQSTIRMPLPSTLPLVQWAVPNWIAHTHESTGTKRRLSCRWGKQNLIGFWPKSSFMNFEPGMLGAEGDSHLILILLLILFFIRNVPAFVPARLSNKISQHHWQSSKASLNSSFYIWL